MLAGGITASSAAYIFINHQRSSPTYHLDDTIHQAIRKQSNTILNDSDHVRIIVFQQKVLLLGQVQTQGTKQQLQRQIETIHSVKAIYNQIAIAPPSAYTSRLHDKWVTTKINTALFNNKALTKTPFATIANNGRIYLIGDQLTPGQIRVIKDKICDISGVKTIIYLKYSNKRTLNQSS